MTQLNPSAGAGTSPFVTREDFERHLQAESDGKRLLWRAIATMTDRMQELTGEVADGQQRLMDRLGVVESKVLNAIVDALTERVKEKP